MRLLEGPGFDAQSSSTLVAFHLPLSTVSAIGGAHEYRTGADGDSKVRKRDVLGGNLTVRGFLGGQDGRVVRGEKGDVICFDEKAFNGFLLGSRNRVNDVTDDGRWLGRPWKRYFAGGESRIGGGQVADVSGDTLLPCDVIVDVKHALTFGSPGTGLKGRQWAKVEGE